MTPAAGHRAGVGWQNNALSGQFASWAGTVLGLTAHPVLIADNEQQLEEARLRMARVGIELLDGYLAGGVAAPGGKQACPWSRSRRSRLKN